MESQGYRPESLLANSDLELFQTAITEQLMERSQLNRHMRPSLDSSIVTKTQRLCATIENLDDYQWLALTADASNLTKSANVLKCHFPYIEEVDETMLTTIFIPSESIGRVNFTYDYDGLAPVIKILFVHHDQAKLEPKLFTFDLENHSLGVDDWTEVAHLISLINNFEHTRK